MTEEEQAVWRERGRCFNRFLVNIAGKKNYVDINLKFHIIIGESGWQENLAFHVL